jgi:hypothetical protein
VCASQVVHLYILYVVGNQNAANSINVIALVIVKMYSEQMGKSATSAYT